VRFENTNSRSGFDVPAAHGAVSGTCDEDAGFGVDAEARHGSRVTGEDVQRTTFVERPRTCAAVGRSADECVVDLHA